MSITRTEKTKLAIVGFGKFGQLLHQLFGQISWLDLAVVSSRELTASVTQIRYTELDMADIVIPCVPIHCFSQSLDQVLPHCRPDATILDVCSVKVLPAQSLLAQALEPMNLVACHPMFGPTSIALHGSAARMPVALWNVRASKLAFSTVKRIWQALAVRLIEISPHEHDRIIARSQAYVQLIGRLGTLMNLTASTLDTVWFAKLLEIQEVVERNSPELFMDIQIFNPCASQMRAELQIKLQQLEADIHTFATTQVSSTIQKEIL